VIAEDLVVAITNAEFSRGGSVAFEEDAADERGCGGGLGEQGECEKT